MWWRCPRRNFATLACARFARRMFALGGEGDSQRQRCRRAEPAAANVRRAVEGAHDDLSQLFSPFNRFDLGTTAILKIHGANVQPAQAQRFSR